MNEYLSFETERLIIKPTCKADAPFIFELFNTPKWIEHIGDRNIHSIKDAEEYIKKKITPQLKKLGYSNYTVVRKSDGIKIGTCGLFDRDGLDEIDIGFAFLPQYENKGYAFESANKIKQIALQHFNINQLSAITTKKNIASQKLLVKLGFLYIKIVRIPNDDEDLLLYKLKT